MNRETRLESCRVCMKRKFLMEKGIVCSLTGEHATFDFDCPDFEADAIAIDKQKDKEKLQQAEDLKSATGGLNQIGIKNGAVAGLIVLLLGMAWLILGVVYLDRIFFYSFVVIGLGISLIVKYYIKLAKQKKKEDFLKRQSDILDVNELDR